MHIKNNACFTLSAKLTLALAASILSMQSSQAEAWRYCLAPDNAGRTVYVSPIRATQNDTSETEAQFGHVLDGANLAHDDVQCPRADDETAARTMRRHTIRFNEQLGRKVILTTMP